MICSNTPVHQNSDNSLWSPCAFTIIFYRHKTSVKVRQKSRKGELNMNHTYDKWTQSDAYRGIMPPLRMGTRTAPIPIIQGGMGVGISLSGLASAVAETGGIGIIAANAIGMIEPDYFKDGRAANIRALQSEIRKAKERTSGIIGVNIMVALQDFHDLLDTAIEEGVDLVIMGAGLPVKQIPVSRMRERGVSAVPIVSSARAAELIFRMWERSYHDVPDAVVLEGPEAGGHLGFTRDELDDPSRKLETLIPQVLDVLRPYEQSHGREIPLIAAGGIYTGEDIYRVMQLGARGVQMGTRFVATHECDADIRFKEAYLNAKKDDIGIITSPVGLPGRAIINDFLRQAEVKKRTFSCPWQCLSGCRADEAHYCISLALNQARIGRLDNGFVFVGSNAYRIKEIISVRELMKDLVTSYLKSAKQTSKSIAECLAALKREYLAAEQFVTACKEAYTRTADRAKEKITGEYQEALRHLDELRHVLETYRTQFGFSGLADTSPRLNGKA